jgi:RNA polymerase sigma-70 factor (ECF subfamily)
MPIDVAACFEAHRARVYRWAYGMCGCHEDALDVVQEVFLRMLRRPPRLAGVAVAVGWLRQVTARVVIDRWRSDSSREKVQRAREPRAIVTETFESQELAERVRKAIETLSEQQRLVLIAKTYDRLTFGQIADELGIAVPTAKTHYLRALSAVRARLAIELPAGRLS